MFLKVSKTLLMSDWKFVEPSARSLYEQSSFVVALLGAAVLSTAKNLIVSLKLVKDLGTAIVEGLDEPIEILIFSSLYKTIADEELSILDLICLAAAVLATLIYKAVTGQNPFPVDSTTSALIAAPDFKGV